MSFDTSKFLKNVEGEARRRAEAAAVAAVDQFANHVVGKAQRITPIEIGTLASSGTAEPPQKSGTKITATVGFNTSYAAAVHERLDAYHEPPTRAKYLETAMQQEARKLVPFVQEEMRKAL